jgi:peptidoglycan glycosyltransferase
MTLTARTWHLANVILLTTLVLLGGRLLYWQLVRGPELQPVVIDPAQAVAYYGGQPAGPGAPIGLEALPQPVIQRTVARLASIRRGTIFDRNRRALAYDQVSGNTDARVYAEPSLAQTVGYVSALRTGVAGIEQRFNTTLLGLDRFDSQISLMVHQPVVGSDIHLTLDSRIQGAAAQALAGKTGAIVVLDAHTGALLALANSPAFDPNRVLDPQYVSNLAKNCGAPSGCASVFLNRATQGLYTPGSTFKTVTLIAALDSGQVTPATIFDFGQPHAGPGNTLYYVYQTGGGTVLDYNHRESRLDLTQSYALSANAAFARIGAEMAPDTLIGYAARLGFGSEAGAPPIEIDASRPQLSNDVQALYRDSYLRAVTAIGQGELLASPLSMALVVEAVVNDGQVPRPHLLQAVRSPTGDVLSAESDGLWLRDVMRPETARSVRAMMLAVVNSGSGKLAAVPGLTIGGKTGTAQLGGNQSPHAWFTGFAEDAQHSLVIAVLVENGGEGATAAAPLFAQVAQAGLRYLNQPVAPSGVP